MPQHNNQTYQQLKNAILQRRFANLNPMQRQAVMAVEGPVLILAGAGSGKTTVLIHRIANLLQFGLASVRQDDMPPLTEEDWHTLELCAADGSYMERASWLIAHDVPAPWNILAITFTNKAAGELRARLAGMLGSCGEDVHAATFHAACSRILRAEIEVLGYSRNFTIYDTDDSVRVIKDAMAELHISDKNFAPKALLANISREILTLLAAPLLVRWFGNLAPISAGGATTMDTTLPIITRTAGQQFVVVSIFHGFVVDFSVPFLVTLFCSI